MLTSTTGNRIAHRFRPNKLCEEQKNVKVKRPVIIGRVVTVKPVLHHLIDEPAVDALVEVRWLDTQEEEAQEALPARGLTTAPSPFLRNEPSTAAGNRSLAP